MNIWDIVLIAALAIGVGLAVRKVIRDRRRGRPCCGGNCTHCIQGCDTKKR